MSVIDLLNVFATDAKLDQIFVEGIAQLMLLSAQLVTTFTNFGSLDKPDHGSQHYASL